MPFVQAADMSALWLKEVHLENTMHSHSHPLVHSLPWQLAHHALVYPQERHIEVSHLNLGSLGSFWVDLNPKPSAAALPQRLPLHPIRLHVVSCHAL